MTDKSHAPPAAAASDTASVPDAAAASSEVAAKQRLIALFKQVIGGERTRAQERPGQGGGGESGGEGSERGRHGGGETEGEREREESREGEGEDVGSSIMHGSAHITVRLDDHDPPSGEAPNHGELLAWRAAVHCRGHPSCSHFESAVRSCDLKCAICEH